ncbi:hypothetical protein DFH07DRAFT_437202 [Mycena maculata]|uniref:Uncharacterized protein n=1 Tax=Mycena maculata TaxID=230809 RepID=A0AAD7K8Q0_9AGAR|nr:hypothetical protein DFH07DRAFT_437202 [Mycena maculata]
MAAAGMMVSTGSYASDWSWRLPLFVQVVPTALNVLFISIHLLLSRIVRRIPPHAARRPRWLYAHGETDGARRILARFHSSNGDLDSPLVTLEIEAISENIALDGADSVFSLCMSCPYLVSLRYREPVGFPPTVPHSRRPEPHLHGHSHWLVLSTPLLSGLSLFLDFFGQLSGNGLIRYFFPVLLKNAGITS